MSHFIEVVRDFSTNPNKKQMIDINQTIPLELSIYKWTVNPSKDFDQQVKLLKRHRFTAISTIKDFNRFSRLNPFGKQ